MGYSLPLSRLAGLQAGIDSLRQPDWFSVNRGDGHECAIGNWVDVGVGRNNNTGVTSQRFQLSNVGENSSAFLLRRKAFSQNSYQRIEATFTGNHDLWNSIGFVLCNTACDRLNPRIEIRIMNYGGEYPSCSIYQYDRLGYEYLMGTLPPPDGGWQFSARYAFEMRNNYLRGYKMIGGFFYPIYGEDGNEGCIELSRIDFPNDCYGGIWGFAAGSPIVVDDLKFS